MKTLPTVVSLVLLSAANASAYNSGSTGVLGDYVGCQAGNPNPIPLSPNGVMHYHSFTVPAGCTVTFLRNADNTPAYILAQTDVTITGTLSANGAITTPALNGWSATYLGGLGGPGGGTGASNRLGAGLNLAMPGIGPGGGNSRNNGDCSYGYSNVTMGAGPSNQGNPNAVTTNCGSNNPTPVVPALAQKDWWILHGGGGGPTSGAGIGNGTTAGGIGGGGVVTIAASGTITINGTVTASSDNPTAAQPWNLHGGGGYLRLVATTLTGSGNIYARANLNCYAVTGGTTACGGAGIVRIETDNQVVGAVTTHIDPPADFVVGSPSRALPYVEGQEPTIRVKSIGGTVVTPNGGVHPLLNIQSRVTAGQNANVVVETAYVPIAGTSVYVRAALQGQVTPIVAQVTNMTDTGDGIHAQGNVNILIPAGTRVGSIEAYIPQVPVP